MFSKSLKKPPTMPKLQGSTSAGEASAFILNQSKVPKAPAKKSKERPPEPAPEEQSPPEIQEVEVKEERTNEKKPVNIIHVKVGPP